MKATMKSFLPKRGMQTHVLCLVDPFSVLLIPASRPSLLFPLSFLLSFPFSPLFLPLENVGLTLRHFSCANIDWQTLPHKPGGEQ